MTEPTPAPQDTDGRTRRLTMLSIGVLLGLIALKAFALGASGSTAMRASLVESVLELIAIAAGVMIVRTGDADRRRDAFRLIHAGLILASAVFVGWDALVRIFLPWPVVGGPWPVAVAVVSLVAMAWLVLARHGDRQGRPPYLGELATGVVALVGVTAGTLLNAPGLDAAAGLTIAVWLFWGGLALARPAPVPETASR